MHHASQEKQSTACTVNNVWRGIVRKKGRIKILARPKSCETRKENHSIWQLLGSLTITEKAVATPKKRLRRSGYTGSIIIHSLDGIFFFCVLPNHAVNKCYSPPDIRIRTDMPNSTNNSIQSKFIDLLSPSSTRILCSAGVWRTPLHAPHRPSYHSPRGPSGVLPHSM